MSDLAALHFPDTAISLPEVAQSLLFFKRLDYLLATEEEGESGYQACQPLTPAPLGDDLERFQRLLMELKGNPAEFYQGQLSNMALDYMENRDDETVMSIVNSLAGQSPQQKVSALEEQLWQARLMLKLAEIHRQEQQELAERLGELQGREHELYQALKGEAELEEVFAQLQGHSPQPLPVRIEVLVRAWGRLLRSAQLNEYWLLSTTDETAAAPLLEVSEAISGQLPRRLLRLALPELKDLLDYDRKRQQWQEDVASSLTDLARLLPAIAKDGLQEESLAQLSQQAAAWNVYAGKQELWPAAAEARAAKKCQPIPQLEFYLLDVALPPLLARICNEEILPPAGNYKYTIVAQISRPSGSCGS